MTREKTTSNLPAVTVMTLGRVTRAENDGQLLESWLANLTSAHSRRNFEVTARRFFCRAPRRWLARRHRRGRTRCPSSHHAGRRGDDGAAIRAPGEVAARLCAPARLCTVQRRGDHQGASDARYRGATLAKRIISEVDVALLVRGVRTKRDRVLLQVLYAGGLRVSELAGLTWSDVLARDHGQVQLSITGKGGVVREVLLPEAVSRALSSLRGDAGANDAVFASRKTDVRLTERAVLGIVKRAAARAGLEAPVSPHWLRHAHASHAISRGATLPEVQATLGHGNIATTSGYLHARPESSSGLKLDPGVFLR